MGKNLDAAHVLERFTPATRAWFEGAFAAPTPAQIGAWDAISTGQHALVVAPTGSGKTLSAFLWALDSFARAATEILDPAIPGVEALLSPQISAAKASKTTSGGTKVLYISPLKALGVDVERNLRAPLVGIKATAAHLGLAVPQVSVGVRSGDTPANDRRKLVTNPPDILITTPESLYLMLTSKARESLAGVHTVIIDEVHAVAGSKRGAHLALSLERLDNLLAAPAQRIGLSATVEPRDEVARFLGGRAPVSIIAPPITKTWDLSVRVPVEDMTDLPAAAAAHDLEPGSGLAPQASIWPHVEEQIVDLIEANRSTIVFANSRRLAERLTGRLNEIHETRLGGNEPAAGFAPNPLGSTGAPVQPGTSMPAAMMAQAGTTATSTPETASGAVPPLARAHHGSVSKDTRATIEDDLKTGVLRAVVATSSLELGIDMGLVDLVIQVESPPSVASGLQRVGRAGHQVGQTSIGAFFPKHRADLLATALTVSRMREGKIEKLHIPANPLDVLAQQTLAACALEELDLEDWFETVRRAAPYAALPRSAFTATLEMLAGKYPSDEFAQLRPRIVWDRDLGSLTGRPGAQRLAVISGGTIPDRGLFGVYLAAGDDGSGSKGGRRVGELDEEMVYESRVGDVFALGATSWKIQDITHDRVLVSPAFGQPGKLPFWKGDSQGRPVELGAALGAFTTHLANAPEQQARDELAAIGLDSFAAGNLRNYLEAQSQATAVVPGDKVLLIERFTDELGDWRVILHSPFGLPVHAPWALAVGARLHERYGLDGSAMAADDGIVLRVPAMDDEPPGAELFAFEADEIEDLVTAQVGNSALFASRFRECAARALLLPRTSPGKRTPLWQQRQRSAQLLDVARKYPDFPIILETVRECLNDVYDLPSLKSLLHDISARSIALREVQTPVPSPFAQSLLFGYVAQFLYEGDSPLAERRAAALSLDPGLLGELLGRTELRELLDAEVIARTQDQLQRTAPDRKLTGIEGTADLLRMLGPLDENQVAARLHPETEDVTAAEALESAAGHLASLVRANRALEVRLGGRKVFAAIEDAPRLRDGLGVPLPHGVPLAFIDPVADPVGDLVSRFARTHGPFTAGDVAAALGLGVAVVMSVLERLVADTRVMVGAFRPAEMLTEAQLTAANTTEYCDATVLRMIRTRSLAALRAEVEPVDQNTFGRFLPAWQGIGAGLHGIDGVLAVVEQLAGVPVPASALESHVLPARVRDYAPWMLDELMSAGEVLVSGAGALAGTDGWIAVHTAENAALSLPMPDTTALGDLAGRLHQRLGFSGAYFVPQLSGFLGTDGAAEPTDAAVLEALWELFWASAVAPDTLAPLRQLLAGGQGAHRIQSRTPRARTATLGRMAALRAGGSPVLSGRRAAPETASGRWAALPAPLADPTIRAHAAAEFLLERYGVLTRGSVAAESVPGGFGQLYRVLGRLEEAGHTRRGYFVEKLGAAQFSTSTTIDRLRTLVREPGNGQPPVALGLAATDPANPYGAALSWPDPPGGHRPGRKAGALVVLLDGALALYVERGGKTVLSFGIAVQVPSPEGPEISLLDALAVELVAVLRRAGTAKLAIEKINGEPVNDTLLGAALHRAGFYSTPSGLRFRGR
ncbi:ATP-dependent helicase [Paeniglutamicibacter gangotriensis]|uniref:ATP-dependent helicase n=1 Tax=Paeniglutamicibacter gangotriensis Lz1y TaxID=1276920 RepID=M7MQC1_9MICC|nr:ATP-dependent helicase [Paeniglutamicibacter gangotriensis]EMQ97231.1 ATP-dependent helicase [Paeniglutamicibacter gangotriensis Lz1y]